LPRVYESSVLSLESFSVHAAGRSEERVRVHVPDWVVVVPITEMGEVILVEQHRHGVNELSLEPPGGRVDPGEDELAAAQRELVEETGYSGGMWETLGWCHPDAALLTNKLWMFCAHDVVPVAAPKADPFERLTVHRVPFDDLRELIVSGRIHHGPSLLALQRVLLVEQALDEGL
jgi:ADP-ribose pyrophosphatase